MSSYLTHLLADIQVAHRKDIPEENPVSGLLKEHFKDIDRWVSGDAKHTVGYYCSLEAEALPPHDQLSEEEIRKICDAFMAMFNSWGILYEFARSVACRGSINRWEACWIMNVHR